MAGDVGATIISIIKSYKREVDEKVMRVSKTSANECAKRLNDVTNEMFPPQGPGKHYAGSWFASKDDDGGYTVHSKVPGMPHLLEDGHNVFCYGEKCGFAPARPHIKPIADQMDAEFEEKVRKALEG